MKKIVLCGSEGKMGKAIRELALDALDFQIVGFVDRNKNENNVSNLVDLDCDYDIIVDFSSSNSLESNLRFAVESKKGYISGITGLSDDQIKLLKKASESIPVFYASNFSYGVFALNKILKTALEILDDKYDLEIFEKHHRNKVDAPSGTAKTLMNIIKHYREDSEFIFGRNGITGSKKLNEICVNSLRGGDIIGDHSVFFSGIGEVIELNHRATSRMVFASGVIKAIQFFLNTNSSGLYSMENLLEKF
ncbi:MAG: 4-hydroxy-tetrahydrodipicolinate reductase [Candidatus Delongbacteria bacterium]|nr:4-hydroxy-tetrahydrodipicolinate reductase [Candidatus Delongbacteria bacterium]MBN2835852.1 4-hydroxy-tetrahydrodipicolinate reductase [Candidatus Delongbacteria bacterium]